MTESIIELDVHGMTLYQAKVVIDAKLRRSAGAYRIRVIHGYHGGTFCGTEYARSTQSTRRCSE